MRVQQTHGNQAAQRLVNERVRPRVQSALEVGAPNDVYEREADRVAEQVMRTTESPVEVKPNLSGVEPSVQRMCSRCRDRFEQGKPLDCPECERSVPEHEAVQRSRTVRPRLQRQTIGHRLQRQCACGVRAVGGECERCHETRLQRTAAGPGPDSSGAPAIVDQTLQSPGRPLDRGTRTFMEDRFGHDFGHVRVHTDGTAAESAQAVGARAYTVGSHIVFARGEYDTASNDGRQLMSHELTHVVQQGGSPVALQRAVSETPQKLFQPGAQVCMIHLHGNEQNALEVAKSMQADYCANLVHLNNSGRCITFDTPALSNCKADPNRIFSTDGVTLANAFGGSCGCSEGKRSEAVTQIRQFLDQQLGPAIRECRSGAGESQLPVVALHNNTRNETTPGALSIESYRRGGSEHGATETDPGRLGGAPNPSELQQEESTPQFRDPDNFLLVTDERDFQALRGQFNVVLQSTGSRLQDDGSLSVSLADQRYINVEAQRKRYGGVRNPFFVTNRQMAEAAFNQLGVSRRPCTPHGATNATGTRDEAVQRDAPAGERAEGEEPEPRSLLEEVLDWLERFLSEVVRVSDTLGRMPQASPREAPPASLPEDCRTFTDQSALDVRKTHWAREIASMSASDVVSWITGTGTPPPTALQEAERQKDCLLHAIRAAEQAGTGGLSLPTGALTRSGRRGFGRQERIWNRKFAFSHPAQGPFGRITDHARQTCGSLIRSSETEWNPGEPRHRVCWGVGPLSGTTAPSLPAGARALTADERQFEILQTSSAPGISRHHAGTDFDLFDPNMDPAEWEVGGDFADEYSWLQRNASTYGFVQSFTATSSFMHLGYIEERWHWSYYPIAQALLAFSRAHQHGIEQELSSQWGGAPQFSFVQQHWREYLFNVSERGVF